MLELTMSSSDSHEPTPVGNYQAKFIKFEEKQTSCGKAYLWVFACDDGRVISDISDGVAPPRPTNKTGRFLMALTAKALAVEAKITPENFYGQKYIVIVVPKGSDGKTQIATFSKI